MIRPHEGVSPDLAGTGIGLRAPHVAEIMASRPVLPWLEVHSENYLGGGPELGRLEQVRREYPVSLHGVGLSLGTDGNLDGRHLARLRALAGRIEPCLVSEHLSWSTVDGTYLNHLLPLPYTEDTLEIVARHVARAQDALRRQLLIENPSAYIEALPPESVREIHLAGHSRNDADGHTTHQGGWQ